MTSTTSFRTIKSRLTGKNSGIQSMTSNGYELKGSRICVKRSLTHFFLASKPSNGNVWYSSPPSPPLIFYPTTEESKDLLPAVPSDVHLGSSTRQSSCSDDEHRSLDSDEADESDHEQSTKQTKSRRRQKTRKPNHSSLQHHKIDHQTPPLIRSYPRKDEPHPQQQQQRSSSNEDEENRESISRLNELNFSNRRPKFLSNRRAPHFAVPPTTTTTTDEEMNKQLHSHPTFAASDSISNLSSPIPTMLAPVRKVNRFQVKSIRKSQQPHILLAKAIAAKSSNEDDCSVPNESLPNLQARPTIVERSSAQTPTTDGEHPLHSRETSENEHHRVRFQITSHGPRDSIAEEEKLPVPSAAAVALPTPAPALSNPPCKEEVSGEHSAEQIEDVLSG